VINNHFRLDPLDRIAVGVKEAAALLSVSVRTIYRMAKNGSLPSVLLEGRRVFPVEALKQISTNHAK
jgi:excisionase family DNA binding protein